MSTTLIDYFEALDRLVKDKTINVPKGSKITNDNVSLEAGRKKGTIKKARPVFKLLIDAVAAAAATDAQPADSAKAVLDATKANVVKYRTLWEEALSREVSLVKELWETQRQWAEEKAASTGEKVTSINSRRFRGSSK